ncbi:MAG TPA: hypothetical protein VM901_10675 [Bdellovibrionota bacterium]|nr:hypothetical protein [Bdellovibrionota bacterium]
MIAVLGLGLAASGLAPAATLQVGSLNLQGWAPGAAWRMEQLVGFLKKESILPELSVLMVQESIATTESTSTASDLAKRLGWQHYFRPRLTDREGLAFLYPPLSRVRSTDVYHIQARANADDYARLALSIQIEQPGIGLVRILNTHLAHEPYMSATRKAQISEILEWIHKLEVQHNSDMLILGGDFNTGPGEYYYDGDFDSIYRSPLRLGLVPAIGATYTWVDSDYGFREHIDHFFLASLAPRLKVKASQVRIYPQPTEQKLSDHNFLRLSLEATRSGATLQVP